ncbi:MAG: LexA family transcriptional regulator [Bacteroidetes bacterium]|nr:LexA family transcriptional regulator [Bacteroidota bacterium]
MNERDRIRQVRRALGLSQQQMGELVGLKQGSYSDMERGKAAPGLALVRILLEQFRVSPQFILLGEGPMFLNTQLAPPATGLRTCPLLGREDMAQFLRLQQNEGWQHHLPQLALPGLGEDASHTWIATEVTQDSMTPTLYPGDLVVCRLLRPQETILDNRIYMIILKDGAWAIKRVLNRLERDGTLLLKSDNQGHATYSLPRSAIAQVLAVHRRLTAKLQGPEDVYDRLNALEQAVWDLQKRS